jgi:hypothetical protein
MPELKVHFLLACHDLTHNVSPANQTLFIAKPNMKHQCFQDQILNEKLIDSRVQETISAWEIRGATILEQSPYL